jgi:hypothetical protein
LTNTTNQTQHPESETITHDLDPTNGDGDYVTHVSVAATQALVIAGNSTDGNTWSASVRWIDAESSDNEFVNESKTDTQLDTVTNDWSRLVRKGPVAEVTVTSEETSGTQNQVNVFVDAHR